MMFMTMIEMKTSPPLQLLGRRAQSHMIELNPFGDDLRELVYFSPAPLGAGSITALPPHNRRFAPFPPLALLAPRAHQTGKTTAQNSRSLANLAGQKSVFWRAR